MARVWLYGKSGMSVLYSVDAPVGAGCANRRDDVLLVQLFLRVARDTIGGCKGFVPPGRPEITVDGLNGPNTQAHLDFFLEETNRRGNNLTRDGRVDPVLQGQQAGSISGKLYTILALNKEYLFRHGSAKLADIRSGPYFPPELAKSLYVL